MRCESVKMAAKQMKNIFVYKGYGANGDNSAVILRKLTEFTDASIHQVSYVTPEEIQEGALNNNVSLLAIGGGFDLGFIKALGPKGMLNIRNYVTTGGSYLGICAGAYFACDYIEFDKGGPLEVVGERFLKFYPGTCVGPMYKPYVYNSRKGAVGALIDYKEPLNRGDLDATPSAGNGLRLRSSANFDRNDCKSLAEDEIASSEGDEIAGQSQYSGCGNLPTLNGNCSGMDKVAESLEVIEASSMEDERVSAVKEVVSNGCECSLKRECTVPHGCKSTHSSKSYSKEQSKNGTCIENQPNTNTGILGNINVSKHDAPDLTNGYCKPRFKAFFNGGGCFIDKETFHSTDNGMATSTSDHKPLIKKRKLSPDTDQKILDADPFSAVTVLSRYTDLNSSPVAAVKCRCGDGVAVLSAVHFEYDADDIDDGDEEVLNIIPDLKHTLHIRNEMFKSVLQHLNI